MKELDRSMRNMPRTYQIRATIPMELFIAMKELDLLDRIDSKITEILYDWIEGEMNKEMKNEKEGKEKQAILQ